ncbi:MAG: DUF6682 family protein [Pseudomonadota bacterium]
MRFSLLETLVATVLDDLDDHLVYSTDNLQNAITEAEVAIVALRPDASLEVQNYICVSGVAQKIASTYNRILGIPRNKNGRAIRLVQRESLDAANPNWVTIAASAVIKEVMFDDRAPLEFFVYPPAKAGVEIEVHASKNQPIYDFNTNPNLIINDIYKPHVIEYALYRLFSRDGDNTPNPQRAMNHLANFQNLMGLKIQSDQGISIKNKTDQR